MIVADKMFGSVSNQFKSNGRVNIYTREACMFKSSFCMFRYVLKMLLFPLIFRVPVSADYSALES